MLHAPVVAVVGHPSFEMLGHAGQVGGVSGIGREVGGFTGIFADVVEFNGGTAVVFLENRPGVRIGNGGGFPLVKKCAVAGPTLNIGVRGVVAIEPDIADVFEPLVPHGADGVDVHLSVPGVSGEDELAMLIGFAAENRDEGAAIDVGRNVSIREVEQGWENIDPTDHRIRAGIRWNFPGPAGDERDLGAPVEEIPFTEG